MKIRSSFLFLAISFFSSHLIANASEPSGAVCSALLKKMIKKGNENFESNMRNHVGPHASKGPWVSKLVDGPRDFIRRKLQEINKDPYPFVARNETPFAMVYAKSAFNRLSNEQARLVYIEEIKADLNKTIETVSAYPSRMQQKIDEAANLTMERIAIKDKLKKVKSSEQGIIVEVPFYQNGVLQEAVRREYYGNTVSMRIEGETSVLRTVARVLGVYDREMGRIAKELKLLESEQAANTQKLEVYAHELLRESSLDPNNSKPNDVSYDEFLNKVNAFYVSGAVDGILKQDYLPPYEAWTAWRWRAFYRQIVNVWWRKRVTFKVKGDSQLDKRLLSERAEDITLWDLIKTFTDKERRALGIDNIHQGFSILKQAKWGRVIYPTVAALLGGGIYGEFEKDEYGQNLLVGVGRAFLADHFKRQECVETDTKAKFDKCLSEYLKTKYPKQYLRDVMNWDELVVQGEIGDEAIREEVESLVQERKVYRLKLASADKINKAIETATEDVSDPLSESFRNALVREPDEMLAVLKITSPTPGVGYLATRHPYAYQVPDLKALSRLAVENREDSMVLNHIISKMREYKFGVDLANDLLSILKDREAFKTTRPLTTDIDKAIDEAIRVERGVQD